MKEMENQKQEKIKQKQLIKAQNIKHNESLGTLLEQNAIFETDVQLLESCQTTKTQIDDQENKAFANAQSLNSELPAIIDCQSQGNSQGLNEKDVAFIQSLNHQQLIQNIISKKLNPFIPLVSGINLNPHLQNASLAFDQNVQIGKDQNIGSEQIPLDDKIDNNEQIKANLQGNLDFNLQQNYINSITQKLKFIESRNQLGDIKNF
ncbi:UNKNOWN [Stylonychia lemnae]|uniref:Uncharacterized protein n=1 Tax=Stylonychia lemnae TaxID=5949 RepID=A0A078A8M3_STYLE|nr:UNKNOWN [Stylonychia lemnae]|eukprot:CDW78231.1 UNKNOWN [Stylonychia lemnae]